MKGVDAADAAGGALDDEVEDESDAEDDMMRERVRRRFSPPADEEETVRWMDGGCGDG